MRVVIAEDEVLLREGVSRILTDEGHEIVATAGNADELLGKVRAHRPDLVLTDIRMPPDFTDDGLRAAKRIRQELPGTGVIVVSQYVDAQGAMELLADGAEGVGYLLKRRILDLDDFLDAVQRVAAGGSSIDSDVISSLVRREVRDHTDGGIARLTPRRREVLQLMAQGYSNARIARELFVTEKAVARSIALIFTTLDLPPDPDDHRRVLAVMRFLGR
ncbi:response regulator transcription factor [Microbacterium azadirachtae]|uniref:Oxygen regulatory protein NreC n=1 Tax=Microbacterium azadirachtae TaxID=582680 RepID=A0A0F0KQQ4_9MICO|nr:response regulator transcription factor [Microbacterium azadirachtae]KJL22789.1 Oxygen regulatory protein NreC [Microbacterium azadirachtae]UXW85771.1 response regulator transcription factor [Microbacterium azadirachtae]SDL73018.1 DNA-binding response regulator, NarL/FixJ family, contains REC and HTH domains [Microbacterium azadirachtae]SEG02302.1 DNA-binding response regulator, NarL/FixJ family, contains REC and HTH domains [Microbacterium azadirachtae]SEG05000.1 DNA-binding response regul